VIRPGVWWIESKKDPRWRASGRGEVGLFARPSEVDAKIEELRRSLGEPPDDLT
jgi:hypothetical protein